MVFRPFADRRQKGRLSNLPAACRDRTHPLHFPPCRPVVALAKRYPMRLFLKNRTPFSIRRGRAVAIACAVIMLAGGAGGDDWRDWSKFGKGSWKRVRSTTETFDRDGRVTSQTVTDRQTTLIERNERRITLRVATTVHVAGKRFESAPTLVVAGRFGESDGEQATLEKLPDDRVEFAGTLYECQRRRVRISGRESNRVVEWASSARFALAPLHRVETLRGPNDEPLATTTENVVAVNLPHKVLDETMPATYVRTIHTNHKITATTLAACGRSAGASRVGHHQGTRRAGPRRSPQYGRSGRVRDRGRRPERICQSRQAPARRATRSAAAVAPRLFGEGPLPFFSEQPAHRFVAVDPLDRLAQAAARRERTLILRSICFGRQRDRVGHDHVRDRRRPEPLDRRAAQHAVRGGDVDLLRAATRAAPRPRRRSSRRW